MKKLLFLLPILAITILTISLAQPTEAKELEECRDGLIIVQLVNAQSSTCKNIETAERWVELGIATITDPNYVSNVEAIIEDVTPVVEPIVEPVVESILKGVEEIIPVIEPEVIPVLEPEVIPVLEEPVVEPVVAPEQKANKNPLPGTPRKVGSQGVQAFGSLLLEVYDSSGNLKHKHENHNLVVNVGLQALSDLAFGTTHVSGESAGGFSWVSVGTGGTAPAVGNTDCQVQHGSKIQDVSVTNTALGAVINVSWIAVLADATLQEICLTDNGAAATGNLFSRQTFVGVPILSTDTINAEWTITFADSDGL